jgi:hypothetical protein
MKFTFNVSKCDKIFDELLSIRKIKLFHTILLIEDLKSVLVVSDIILILLLLMVEMYFGDKNNWLSIRANCVSSKCRWTIHFPLTPLIYKVVVWPEQAKLTKVKNVIIYEERPKSCEDKIWSREVVLEKVADGKNVLKITIKISKLELGGGGGQASSSKQNRSSVQ